MRREKSRTSSVAGTETMTKHNSRAPLRLVLVTESRTIPNWLFKSLEQVEQSGAAQCALVLRATQEVERGSLRSVQRLRRFLFWLYQNVVRRLVGGFQAPHAPMDLQSPLPHCRF